MTTRSSSRHSIVVKVHKAPCEVPFDHDCKEHEEGDGHHRVEKDRRLVEYLKRAVPQERDVNVVPEGHHPQRVSEGGRRVSSAAYDRVVEEELQIHSLIVTRRSSRAGFRKLPGSLEKSQPFGKFLNYL